MYKLIPEDIKQFLDSPDETNHRIIIEQKDNLGLDLEDIIYYLVFNKKDWSPWHISKYMSCFDKIIFSLLIRVVFYSETGNIEIFNLDEESRINLVIWNEGICSPEHTVRQGIKCLISILKQKQLL